MNSKLSLLAALALATLSACSSTTEKTCADFCGTGNVCQDGQCVALQAASCTTTYPGCATCDTSGTPAWVGQCGTGTTCSAATDSCVATPCSPACGPGTACQNGACVAVEAVTCTASYPGCSACIVSGQTASWQGICGAGTTCNPVDDACVSTSNLHASFGAVGGPLHGPFASGYAVTAQCVGCHPGPTAEVLASQHWTWKSPGADLVAADGVTPITAPVGKLNLVNNFCVSTPSNDKRCDQCHAGFGGDPDPAKPQKSARNYASADPTTGDSSIPLQNRIDCLVCHSNPTAGYAKDPKNFGNPLTTLNLAVAAQDIRMPTRSNCGACHFYAGGGDNVKLMGSSLKNPTEALDVHMGRGMECLDCHAGPAHTFRGGGVHTPGHAGRVSCADCHSATPHEGKVSANGEALDTHAARLACQTCHIPAFSRGQFGKVDWDWSTAGNNTVGVAGVVTTKVNDDGTPNPASASSVTTYDYIKGNFVWKKNIAPAYRWSNGKGTHALLSDKGDMTGMGLTTDDATRLSLGEPVGTQANGKIMPFKLMRGRQAVYVDGASSYVVNPNLMGTAGFWGVIQAAGFNYATYDFDAAGPIGPGQPSIDALWGKILAVGAIAAGQAPAGTPAFARFDAAAPTVPGYDWRYTKLYMDLNHEVAPKAKALGSTSAGGGGCADCHGASPKIPICELYPVTRPGIFAGVTCP